MIDSGFKRKSLARNYARTMTAEPVETTGRRRLTQDPPRVLPGEDPGSKQVICIIALPMDSVGHLTDEWPEQSNVQANLSCYYSFPGLANCMDVKCQKATSQTSVQVLSNSYGLGKRMPWFVPSHLQAGCSGTSWRW